MQPMRLYGTQTSPYVRRVRVVARELGLSYELIDTASDAGQAALRAVSPVWKVPVAELEGVVVFDSNVIIEALVRAHGSGPLAIHEPSDWATRNTLTVIDGALDALINCFYLTRDGVTGETAAYLQKQQDRAASAMTWLDARVAERSGFGLVEVALCTTIGWMQFRSTYPVERHPALLRCYEQHRERSSLALTEPQG